MKTLLQKAFFILLLVSSAIVFSKDATAQTVTFNPETTNLLPNNTTLTGYTNNLAVYGFSITVTGATESIGTINIRDAISNNDANLFTNGRLYRTSSAGYNSSSPGTSVGTVTFGSSLITISGMNENFAVGETRYYYLVVDCIATSNTNFQPNIGYGQTPSGIISTGGTSYNNNNNGYENYYFIAAGTPPPVSMSKLSGGVTLSSSNLIPGQSGAAVFGFSVTTNANRTFTQFNINSTSNALTSYIASAILYSNTTNTYGTGTKTAVGTATIGSTYITVNTSGETVNNTTKYYFLVVTMKSSITTVPATLQFNFTSGQSSAAITQSGGTTYNTINVLGDTYNVNSSNVTVAALTGGLTSGTITAGQTGVVLFGFSVASSTSITVSGFNINSTNAAADNYFGNAKLYRTNTNNYATATTKTLIGTVALNGSYAQVTGLAETETSTAKYYFLVADNISAVAPTATIAFNFISGQTSDAIIQSGPAVSNYNTFTISGNTLTLPAPTVVITGLNSAGTNNITTAISPGSSNVAVFGFKVKAYGNVIIDKFNIPFSTAYQNTFFSNGRLVESADDVYDANDLNTTIGAVSVSATSNANIGDAGNMGLTFSDNTRNFFLVVDVNVYNNNGTPSTSNYSFTTGQNPTAVTFGSPYSTLNPSSNIGGATLNFPPGSNTYIWTGNVSTVTTNTSNWAGFAAPNSTTNNIVIPGGRPNYPQITSASSIGNITFSGTGASLDLNGFTLSPQSITLAGNATATFTGTGGVGSITPTAGIIINTGATLNVSAPISLPNSSGGTFINDGTLALTGAGSLTIPNATATAASTNTGTISQDGTGALTFTGNFTNAGTINRTSSGTFGISGTLNNSGTILKSGTGVTTFTGAVTNSSTGTITNAGTSGALNFSSTLANAGTVELSNAAPITITGAVTPSSGSNLINSGTGIFTLSSNLTNAAGANITQSGTGSFVFSGTLTNNGTITFGGGPATITGVFNNASTGSIDLGSAGTKDFNGVLTFTNAGAMTMSGGTATIAATTFSNSGTLNATGGTINFDGTTQAINSTNTTTPFGFYNLTLSNSGVKTLDATGTGLFEINSLGTLTLTSNITFAAGTNKLTLNSDGNGSATLAALPTGASVTGTVKVERYLTGNSSGSRGWRLLSSPVSVSSSSLITPNLTYVHANAYTTGSTGTGGGFDATGNPTFYFYRENMAPNTSSFISGNFRGVNKINNTTASTFSFDGGDTNASLPAGNGFLFFFRGDRATTSNPTVTTTIAKPTTITASGYLNQGNITVKPWFTGAPTLSYTSATPTSVRGFNLVGNPYASSIDWENVTKTNITSTMWIYNPILKVYATYVAGIGANGAGTNFNGASGTANIIPSGQGFFVKSTSTAATLTFTESNKVGTQIPSSSLLLATAPVTPAAAEYLRIQIYQDSLSNEDALVFFNKDASSNFVQDEDGEYFRGESTVNISTQSADNVALAINQLPHLSGRQIIPLNVNVSADGQYQINLTEIKNVPQVYDVYLLDNYKKDSLDLRSNSSYTFSATINDPNSFGSSRFSLLIKTNQTNAYRLLDFAALKVLNTVQLSWKTQNEGNTTTFIIERSTDGGITYNSIYTGQSTGVSLYSYIDPSPNLSGQNLYRLKQQDVIGAVTYSVIIPVSYLTATGDSKLIKVYPNPTSSVINLTISSTNPAPVYNIIISNIAGVKIKTFSTSQTNWQGDVSTLYPGTYFIEVISETDKKVIGKSRFIKL